MGELENKLEKLQKSEIYPFHMPGHKRQFGREENWYHLDITEIEGFDNLHHAQGVLKNLSCRWRDYYKAKNAWLLVNGSTCGILAAICASTKPQDEVLICRNAHKSVYHGLFLQNLKATYLYPEELEFGISSSISPERIEEALIENPKISTVVVTSPTYDGILSDIEKISEIVHRYGKILIVDSAHGAHLPGHEALAEYADCKQKKDSNGEKPDLVIMSLHKTLPSLTQTALLIQYSNRPEIDRLDWYLNIFQTSSPSYLLFLSMERALDYLETHKEVWEDYNKRLEGFYRETEKLQILRVFSEKDLHSSKAGGIAAYGKDKTKILISTKDAVSFHGEDLMKELRQHYGIECEMCAPEYVIALSSLMDGEEGFYRLTDALKNIDRSLILKEDCKQRDFIAYPHNKVRVSLGEAMHREWERVSINEAGGRISGEFAYLYPPGIPILVPGEEITEDFATFLQSIKVRNYELNGLSDYRMETIKVLKML